MEKGIVTTRMANSSEVTQYGIEKSLSYKDALRAASAVAPLFAPRFLKILMGGVPVPDCPLLKGFVVTQESARSRKSKIKIPTICKAFNVKCINTYDMLSELKAKL